MKPTGRITTLVTLAAAGALGGCAGTPAPTFSVLDARLAEETDDGYVVHFLIEGENRGKEPLPLHDIDYTLTVDGQRVFQGVRIAGVTLPRFGTSTITLPVAFDRDDPDTPPPAGVWNYDLRGHVIYENPGVFANMLFENRIRRPGAPFNEQGAFNFDDTR